MCALLAASFTLGCERRSTATAGGDTAHDVAPVTLQGEASTLQELGHRFVAALAHGDSATLAGLRLSRAEFAHLYYPSAPQAQPPYSLPEDVMWLMLDANSAAGLAKLREMRDVTREQPVIRCKPAVIQGANRVYSGCVAASERSAPLPLPLIVERQGRFKFVSFG